jgi:hypothetical protein
LAADFVILDEGREPALGVSAAMLAGGVLVAGFIGFGMVKRRGKRGEPGKPGAPESDPETPQGAA